MGTLTLSFEFVATRLETIHEMLTRRVDAARGREATVR